MRKFALIPIDNRPVCYQLPKMIANIDSDVNLLLPPKKLLGGLKTSSDIVGILDWVRHLDDDTEALIVSLDTVTYGGLINSRRTSESYEDVLARVNTFLNVIKSKKFDVYAFSSIMRISNNNCNEEEKFYWDKWGKKIFDFSYNLHMAQVTKENEARSKSDCIMKSIPDEIYYDYIKTRKRNYDINLYYFEKQKQGIFKKLIFSKDDCAKYGFNVKEANCLKLKGAIVKTGADEIPLTLLVNAMYAKSENKPKIFISYTNPKHFHKISKYEDISVRESCIQQIQTVGASVAENEDDADIIMHVNNFQSEQGDLVLGDPALSNAKKISYLKPFLVADVMNANGADNVFIKENFHIFDSLLFLGYAAWNTTGNTLGSALSAAVTKYMAKSYSEKDFIKLQVVRMYDDWAYQANARKKIKEYSKNPDIAALNIEIATCSEKIKNIFRLKSEPTFSFPWDRFFEIEVNLK